MNCRKVIEESLKEKISANEERIRSLFNFKPNKEKSSQKSYISNTEQNTEQKHKHVESKIDHQIEFENISQNEKFDNNFNTLETKSNNNSVSMSISTKNNESYLVNHSKLKKNDSSKNRKKYRKIDYNTFNPIKKFVKNNNQVNTINYNYSYNYNNYHNNNYNYNFNFNTKNKKSNFNTLSKANKEIHNYNIKKNYYNYMRNPNNLESLNFSVNVKQPVNLNQMLERFEEDEIKKQKKIEKLKLEQQEKELEQCSHQPSISKKTINMNKQIKDDFLTRQKKYKELAKEKSEKLKESILQNELNKINENNFLLLKKNRDNTSIISGLNSSLNSDFSLLSRTKPDVDSTINRLYEWDKKRKEKIEKKREDQKCEDDEDENDHIPKIDKRSSSMAERRNMKNGVNENIFERLSKEDEILKEKRRLMVQLTTPSFQPNLYLTRKYNYDDIIEENYDESSYYNDEYDEKIMSKRNTNLKPWRNDDNILNNELKKLENDEVHKRYRKAIIDKINQRNKIQSAGKKKSRKYKI